jgi:hypothetical protein
VVRAWCLEGRKRLCKAGWKASLGAPSLTHNSPSQTPPSVRKLAPYSQATSTANDTAGLTLPAPSTAMHVTTVTP